MKQRPLESGIATFFFLIQNQSPKTYVWKNSWLIELLFYHGFYKPIAHLSLRVFDRLGYYHWILANLLTQQRKTKTIFRSFFG